MVHEILVCGGRDYSDKKRVFEILDLLDPDQIVHGDARGADRLAGEWAKFRERQQYPIAADWDLYPKSAGPIRNALMLIEHPNIEIVVAFPGGRGTEDMKRKALKKKIPVLEVL